MQNTKTTETRGVVVFSTKLEVVPGGRTVAVADMVQSTLYAGTPVGVDANGLGHIIKVAELYEAATNSATDYKVKKTGKFAHNFKVGEHICAAEGAKAQTITAITKTETDYDTISVGTSIGTAIAINAHIYQAAAADQSTAGAFLYTPDGLVGEDATMVVGGNNFSSVVVRGSVITGNTPPVGAVVKAKLPLIRFVNNY